MVVAGAIILASMTLARSAGAPRSEPRSGVFRFPVEQPVASAAATSNEAIRMGAMYYAAHGWSDVWSDWPRSDGAEPGAQPDRSRDLRGGVEPRGRLDRSLRRRPSPGDGHRTVAELVEVLPRPR